jgi:methionyl-tRNA synthetase
VREYERLMDRCEFHTMMNLLDGFIRSLNKTFSARMKEAGDDAGKAAPALADALHTLRVAAALSHPVVPEGAEMIAEYFALNTGFFSWELLSAPLNTLCAEGHTFKFLEPRVDFFKQHPAQLEGGV